MKYRCLSEEELIPLEKDFVDFLVVNGIDAQTWTSKLKNDPKAYRQMVESFSDTVFEKIVRSTNYLLKVEKSLVSAIDCREKKLKLISLTTEDGNLDLTDLSSISTQLDNLHIYTGSKTCQNREAEVWKLLDQGYFIDKDKWYDRLSSFLSDGIQ